MTLRGRCWEALRDGEIRPVVEGCRVVVSEYGCLERFILSVLDVDYCHASPALLSPTSICDGETRTE